MTTKHAAVILLSIGLFLPVRGWSVFDPGSDIPDGMGNTIMLDQPSAGELLSLPAGGMTEGGLKVETGYCRKFTMKELDRVYGAAAMRFGRWTTVVGLSQFGREGLYSEKVGRLALAFRFDSLALGVTLSALQLEFGGGYDDLTAVTPGLSCGYSRGRLRTALALENLTTPRLSANSPEFDIVSSLYVQLLGPGPYSIAGRLTLEENEKAQFGLGQKIRLSPYGSFFWGVSSQPTTYGGGVEMNYHNYLITVAATYHPVLGISHTIALGMVRGGDRDGH